jgi:hypothetical protein
MKLLVQFGLVPGTKSVRLGVDTTRPTITKQSHETNWTAKFRLKQQYMFPMENVKKYVYLHAAIFSEVHLWIGLPTVGAGSKIRNKTKVKDYAMPSQLILLLLLVHVLLSDFL